MVNRDSFSSDAGISQPGTSVSEWKFRTSTGGWKGCVSESSLSVMEELDELDVICPHKLEYELVNCTVDTADAGLSTRVSLKQTISTQYRELTDQIPVTK